MLLSLSWLREFVPYTGSAAELGRLLTMVGLERDGLSRPYEGLRPIVVGHVLECGRHPEADKLSVCRVDVGDETLDIVCGAPNVAKGQKVAVVKVGVTLPSGLTVKKAKLRGAPSNGMICSESELGLSEDHDGILVLDEAAPVGASLLDVLGLDDEVLDISITPNRGDCLSVLGLAREVAAVTGLPLTLPKLTLEERGPDVSGEVALEVADPDLCSLYHGRVIEGAATRRSPAWLRYRLNAVGVRAISNLVDVTNYILMELGQPLHAFDLDTVRGGRIIVRGAEPGETLVTLDGQERSLLASDITIRDTQRAIGLGGVMGGLNSEITEKSSRVFLECAVFNPTLIRKTARRLALHSEAAYRFERGVDQIGATYALERAAAMMAELSGGSVRTGLIKTEPAPWTSPRIHLRKSRGEALLGISLERTFYTTTLTRLGCEVRDADRGLRSGEMASAEEWDVIPPSYRRDLTREADLIEEIARIYGVDRVPPVLPVITHLLERAGGPRPKHEFLTRIKHWGRGAGLHEAINYSFVSHKELDHLAGISGDGAGSGNPNGSDGTGAGQRPGQTGASNAAGTHSAGQCGCQAGAGNGRISIMNPLSDEMNVLRTHLAPGLLNSLRNNLAQGAGSVRLFEVASTFTADPASETTAREVPHLGIILHGTRFEQAWPQSADDLDYLDLKGLVEHLFASLTLPEASFGLDAAGIAGNASASGTAGAAADAGGPAWLAPCVRVAIGGRCVGWMGRVKPDVADPYHAKKPVWMAELDLDRLFALHQASTIRFAQLPVFPPVRRDITFIAAPGVTAGAIIEAVQGLNLPLLSSVRLIDCFEPKEKDEKNLTFRLTFRHADRTLKDAEADKQRESIAAAVQAALPVRV